MIVTSIKTGKIRPRRQNLEEVFDKYLDGVEENSVLAVTSKIVAICEGRTVPMDKADKHSLAIQESDFYLPRHMSRYGYSFTITHNTLIPVAGIDESNGAGEFVLWPAEPQQSANKIRRYLVKRFGINNIGVLITDSTARPLHYGTEGIGIAYSGFSALNDYVGQKDLFGREFKVSLSNVVDALASSAVLVMGEGTEQTPMAVIKDLPFVDFQDRDPTETELNKFFLSHMEDDLFEPFLRQMGWQKGGRGTP